MTMENSNQTLPVNAADDDSLKAVLGVLKALWRARLKIIRNFFVAAIVTLGLTFLIPKKFTAEVTILPDMDLMSMFSQLGGLQDLASAAGLSQGIQSPSQLYPDILMSERILRPVIYAKYKSQDFDSLVNLVQFYGYDSDDENLNYEKCLQKMQKTIVNVSVDKKTFVLTLDVETPEAALSASVANRITTELDQFQRFFRRSHAADQRKFLDERIRQVSQDLARSEDSLKTFREKNRAVAQSPQLSLDQDRLARVVSLNTEVYIELRKQVELARLDEIKNIPIVQVLDDARIPAQKSWPKRGILTAIVAFLTVCFSTAWYIFQDHIVSSRTNADASGSSSELADFMDEVRSSFSGFWRLKRKRSDPSGSGHNSQS